MSKMQPKEELKITKWLLNAINSYHQDVSKKTEIKSSENNEQLKEQRRLHYDRSLWTLLTIFFPAMGIIITAVVTADVINENVKLMLFLFGWIFTMVTFYLAVSFRELRHRLGDPIVEQNFPRRLLPQWIQFVVLFVALEMIWFVLIMRDFPNWDSIWVSLWVSLFIIGLIATFVLDHIVRCWSDLSKYVLGLKYVFDSVQNKNHSKQEKTRL